MNTKIKNAIVTTLLGFSLGFVGMGSATVSPSARLIANFLSSL